MKLPNPLKTVAQKAVSTTKEVIKEEASKTSDEIKEDIKSVAVNLVPVALTILAAAVLIAILKKPIPVVVKVVIKQ